MTTPYERGTKKSGHYALNMFCNRVMWLHEGELQEIGEPKKVLEDYKKFMSG